MSEEEIQIKLQEKLDQVASVWNKCKEFGLSDEQSRAILIEMQEKIPLSEFEKRLKASFPELERKTGIQAKIEGEKVCFKLPPGLKVKLKEVDFNKIIPPYS